MATSSGDGKGMKFEKKENDIMLKLCDLPNEILLRILSLIPLKSAVATSVLSRRWQFLWARFPNLKVDEDMFRKRTDFINFVDRAIMLHHGSSLVSFSLTCCVLKNSARINLWITSSVLNNVKELSLDLRGGEQSYMMPRCIFESQSLLKFDLTTTRGYILRVPTNSICLTNLKWLRLTYVTFPDDESAEKLLSLPMLEELIIGWCSWRNVKAVRIYAPKLQSVEIHEFSYNRDEDYDGRTKVWIFADGIRSFLFQGNPFNEFRICGSTMQLIKAQILVDWQRMLDFDGSSIGGAADHCYELINGLSYVQELTLTDDLLLMLQHIPKRSDTIPVFECLTQLNLDDSSEVRLDRWMLMNILERCPVLEYLNIKKVITHRWKVPRVKLTAPCFQTHLKKIRVVSYALAEDEDINVAAIDIFLKSAYVLEELIICLLVFNTDEAVSSKITEIGEMLNKRPRASKDCKISIVLDYGEDGRGWELDDW